MLLTELPNITSPDDVEALLPWRITPEEVVITGSVVVGCGRASAGTPPTAATFEDELGNVLGGHMV